MSLLLNPHSAAENTRDSADGPSPNTASPIYVNVLQAEYETRRTKNKRYSLRAFARDIHVSPSHLLRVLQLKKKLSGSLAREISNSLGFVGPKAHRFLESVAHHERHDPTSDENPLDQSRSVTPDEFERISEWQYLAALELCEIDAFVVTPLSVSRSLKISIEKAEETLSRLQNLSLIKKTSRTGYRKNQNWVHTSDRSKTNFALKLHQKSILLKSIENIDSIPLEQRANFSSMYAIDPNQIGEAKGLINQFIVDLEKLLAGKKRTQVYAAGIFLTPLSQILKSDKK